ncbi:MAG: glycoside hydrolase family 43 protein [Balneolaceae bacterium]
MHRIFVIALFVSLISCTSQKDSGGYFDETNPPLKNIFLGDPSVLLAGNTYYMYGTGVDSDTGIEVYTSQDLEKWTGPSGPEKGFALYEEDVFGDHFFWAPEVYQVEGKYHMFYSVQEHMAIATSENPDGPFTQDNPGYLADFKAIDHHLFIDDDGNKYLYFAKFEDGLEIWAAEMEDDLSAIRENGMKRALSQSQEWEKSQKEPVGIVNEGPAVIKYKGLYYMIYSANHYASPDYGIGLAYAEDPLGPWKKDENNPILQNADSLVGIGHSSFFTDEEDQLYMVYHAHNSAENVHPRKAYFNPVQFVPSDDSDRFTLEVQKPRFEPKAKLP